MNDAQKSFLDKFLLSLSAEERKRYSSFSAGYFCADEVNANICSDLILSGEKTATCGMKYWYENGHEPMPDCGHLHVVTTWQGQPTSIIETIEVSECRFSEVTAEFAEAEGEGDKSLKWWRHAHWVFFSNECLELGIKPSQDMLLVLERFKVVFV